MIHVSVGPLSANRTYEVLPCIEHAYQLVVGDTRAEGVLVAQCARRISADDVISCRGTSLHKLDIFSNLWYWQAAGTIMNQGRVLLVTEDVRVSRFNVPAGS